MAPNAITIDPKKILYLAAMDITFDVENGMYRLITTNDAMKFEVFINASCVVLGIWTLVACWRWRERA